MDRKNIEIANHAAIVEFTDEALLKMLCLIIDNRKEVGWHGTVDKIATGTYKISDVYVYPQTVTESSIRCENDGLEYGKWEQEMILNNPDRAAKRKFHGHSHVTMGIGPSMVDLDLQKDIIEMTPDDGFYLFLIANKYFDSYWMIVDGEDGLIYTDALIANNIRANICEECMEKVKNCEGRSDYGYWEIL